ncbi:MAG: hypothetical protein WKF59_13225 [Chitinophagaceae bacterium]
MEQVKDSDVVKVHYNMGKLTNGETNLIAAPEESRWSLLQVQGK